MTGNTDKKILPDFMRKRRALFLAGLLFAVLFPVYWVSVPGAFNTEYRNRRFFDSDGEFIVRQFHQNKTYTHNDHLLYHVLAKAIHKHGHVPGLRRDPVNIHKFLSAFFGALGIAVLYFTGQRITGKHGPALLAALFAGGCAGWWFFSSTIDTYIPCLAVCVIALCSSVTALQTGRLRDFAWTGLWMGVAFLLRTDSFLLLALGIVLLSAPKRLPANMAAMGLAGLASGVMGYFILTHAVYGIAWSDVPAWAFGSLNRPEAQAEKIWGVMRNLSWKNLELALVNQLFYTVLIPGLERTRDLPFHKTYTAGGLSALFLCTVILLTCLSIVGRKAISFLRNREYKPLLLLSTVPLWFLPRLVFYTWWDPYDPFLFAVMNLPALWLLLVMGSGQAAAFPGKAGIFLPYVLPGIAAVMVWTYNAVVMIGPLNEVCR